MTLAEAIVSGAAVAGVVVQIYNALKVRELKVHINSRMTEYVKEVKDAAFAKGQLEPKGN